MQGDDGSIVPLLSQDFLSAWSFPEIEAAHAQPTKPTSYVINNVIEA
jgi:hypothetical protein